MKFGNSTHHYHIFYSGIRKCYVLKSMQSNEVLREFKTTLQAEYVARRLGCFFCTRFGLIP